MKKETILSLEAQKSFDFFWNEANSEVGSKGFGLIRDNTSEEGKDICSIASVGFGLSVIPIGVERGWITREEGFERAKGTLLTFLNNAEHVEGFYYHFLHMDTAKRHASCEASIIDTALFLNGAIVVAEYFGEEINSIFEELYKRVNWNFYRDEEKDWFYMSYKPEVGHQGQWDVYGEQLVQYLLGAASPTHPVPKSTYDVMQKLVGRYDQYEFIYSWYGSLFTHQFSHAWFDFRNVSDDKGTQWFENSRLATLANRQYCIDNPENFKAFHENSWGLTASDGPSGYSGLYGAPPTGRNGVFEHKNDGTVVPAAVAGSIPFAPEECMDAIKYFYEEVPELWGKYGFYDSYNLEGKELWCANRYIGIDKGITLLMIENYESGLIWDLYMKNKYVKKGAEILNWQSIK